MVPRSTRHAARLRARLPRSVRAVSRQRHRDDRRGLGERTGPTPRWRGRSRRIRTRVHPRDRHRQRRVRQPVRRRAPHPRRHRVRGESLAVALARGAAGGPGAARRRRLTILLHVVRQPRGAASVRADASTDPIRHFGGAGVCSGRRRGPRRHGSVVGVSLVPDRERRARRTVARHLLRSARPPRPARRRPAPRCGHVPHLAPLVAPEQSVDLAGVARRDRHGRLARHPRPRHTVRPLRPIVPQLRIWHPCARRRRTRNRRRHRRPHVCERDRRCHRRVPAIRTDVRTLHRSRTRRRGLCRRRGCAPDHRRRSRRRRSAGCPQRRGEQRVGVGLAVRLPPGRRPDRRGGHEGPAADRDVGHRTRAAVGEPGRRRCR